MIARKAQRLRARELGKLVADWDPLGVVEAGGPADEYDCLVSPLFKVLDQQPSVQEVTSFLVSALDEHFGVDASASNLDDIALRLLEWSRHREREAES
jgi:hypothetical protein